MNKNLKSFFEYDDDYVMYILINKDIYLDQDQVIDQCCNSILKVVRENEQRYNIPESHCEWRKQGEKKIFLKMKQEDLLYAINNYSDMCQHSLDTDNSNSPFTITTVAFMPMLRKDKPDFFNI